MAKSSKKERTKKGKGGKPNKGSAKDIASEEISEKSKKKAGNKGKGSVKNKPSDAAPYDPHHILAMATNLVRAYRTQLGGRLSELDLYPGQERVLILLNEAGPLPSGHIAEKLQIRSPTVTKTVNRLMATGLVARRRHADDGRLSVVALTEKGEGLLAQIQSDQTAVAQSTLKNLNEKDLARLSDILARLSD